MSLEEIGQLKKETVKTKKVKATVFIDFKFCKAARKGRKNVFAASLSKRSVNFAFKGQTWNRIFMDDATSFKRFVLRTYSFRHQNQSTVRAQSVPKQALLLLLFL